MRKSIVQEKFDHISKNYDEQRKKLIPCFDDFYRVPISFIEYPLEHCRVLDIGGGTGLFTMFLLEKFPKANVTLIDLSEQMLHIARQRFSDNPNVEYIVDDYTRHRFSENFDVIISALSIHHLTDKEKRDLSQKCYSLLNPNGVFINADQVLGSTPYIERINKNAWKDFIENSGLTREEITSAYERISLDKEARLDDQLTWLKEAGFKDVECIYKYYHFAVMFGRKLVV